LSLYRAPQFLQVRLAWVEPIPLKSMTAIEPEVH
jgi:hypothetical protein